MEITKKSIVTGKVRTLDIDITPAQHANWKRGTPIQQACPHLSIEDREFLISGVTKEEWDTLFPPEE